MRLLDLPATADVARAVYGTIQIDEPRLSTALGLSRHTVRLTLAELRQVGAITMTVARDGVRTITVLPEAEYWSRPGVLAAPRRGGAK